jgi:TonB family protein
MCGSSYRGLMFAGLILQALLAIPLAAQAECSILSSQMPFPYSAAAQVSLNQFVGSVCGGARGDIYAIKDSRFGEQLVWTGKPRPRKDPPFPSSAKWHGPDALIVVAYVVEVDGSVKNAAVIESSGRNDLDASAAAWIKRAKFEGALKLNGQAVRTLLFLPIHLHEA